MITDEQIFNHMMPPEVEYEECIECGGEVEVVEHDYYITAKCLNCGYEPEPKEE